MRRAGRFIAIALLALWALPAYAHDSPWTAGPAAPAGRSETGIALADGRAYVVGDYNRATGTLVYDLAAAAWSETAPFPYAVHHPMAVGLDGRVYVFGGYVSGWNATARAWMLDPASSNGWQPIADLPTARAAGGAVALDGRLYVIGGSRTNGVNVPAVEAYDPAIDSWAVLAPLPTPRDHLSLGVVDGRIVVAGGRVDGDPAHNLAVTEIYDPATDSWSTAADMPTPRSGAAAAVLDGRLFVLGGETRTEVFSTVEAYDPASNSWQAFPPLPTPRHGFGAVMHDGAIVTLTGSPEAGGGRSPVVEILRPQ